MSLRSFHILFITASLALMAFLILWSVRASQAWLTLASACGLAAGLPYLGWFLRKAVPQE